MRHDHILIKHVSKLYGNRLAHGLQKLPFFYISEEIESNFASFKQRNESGYKKQYPEFKVDLLDFEEITRILPFPMIVIMDHDIGWHTIDWRGDGKWSMSICVDRMLRDLGVDIPPGTLFGFDLKYLWGEDNHPKVTIEASLLVNQETGTLEGMSKSIHKRFTDLCRNHEFLSGMGEHLSRNLQYFLSFFKWAEGMHMVEVRKKPNQEDLKHKAKGYKKPWLRSDLPHYVYLDAPKSVRDGHGNYVPSDPTHSVRGHNRRAHWRSLTNPRFRNHPMYGKRIRVKATWVGPTEWTVGDTIYTVKGDKNVFDSVSGGADSSNEGEGVQQWAPHAPERVEHFDTGKSSQKEDHPG